MVKWRRRAASTAEKLQALVCAQLERASGDWRWPFIRRKRGDGACSTRPIHQTLFSSVRSLDSQRSTSARPKID